MNANLPPFVWYDPEVEEFYQMPNIVMTREFHKRWHPHRHSFPQSKADVLNWAQHYNSTQCWDCQKYYHISSPTCQFCDAKNANVDWEGAQRDKFDKENNVHEVANLLYKLGWRPDCDAQCSNLRENIGQLRALLNGPAKPTVLDLHVNGKIVGSCVLTLTGSIAHD